MKSSNYSSASDQHRNAMETKCETDMKNSVITIVVDDHSCDDHFTSPRRPTNLQQELMFETLVQERSLPKDTISLIMFTSSKDSWVCAFLVYFIQKLLYIFVMIGIFVHKDYYEACPIYKEHIGTQFLMLIILLLKQQKIRDSLNQWHDGYNDKFFASLEGTERWKWKLSSAIRFVNGFTLVAVAFFLILASETVVDILLNFLAAEVITNFDECAFKVAKEGYFGRAVQRDSYLVDTFKYRVVDEDVDEDSCCFDDTESSHTVLRRRKKNGIMKDSRCLVMLFIWIIMAVILGLYVYVFCRANKDEQVQEEST